MVIFLQGCSRDCKGCHNKEAQDPNGGFDISIKELVDRIVTNRLISGITISGGEPFEQAEATLALIREIRARKPQLTIWVYTGYLFEELLDGHKDILEQIDVLVDGPFILEKKSMDLKFRGSSNQRIIHMKGVL